IKRKLEDDFYQNHLRAIYFGIYVPSSDKGNFSDGKPEYVYVGFANYLLEGNRLTKDDKTTKIENTSGEDRLEAFKKTLDSEHYVSL
ncbi:hypothetical protein C1O31_11340, partial [Staphylococcus schleiferi]